MIRHVNIYPLIAFASALMNPTEAWVGTCPWVADQLWPRRDEPDGSLG